MGKTCNMCGTKNGDGLKFCSACGNALESPKSAASPSSATSGGQMKTMMLTPQAPKARTEVAPISVAPANPASSQATLQSTSKRTVLGMPAVTAESASAEPKAIPVAQATVSFSSPAVSGTAKAEASPNMSKTLKPKAAQAKTMLGMASVTQPSTPPASREQPVLKPVSEPPKPAVNAESAKTAAKSGSKTMLGMPAMGMDAPPEKSGGVHKAPRTEPIAAQPEPLREKPSTPPAKAKATDVMPAKRAKEAEVDPEAEVRPEANAPRKKSKKKKGESPPSRPAQSLLRDSEYDEADDPPKNRGMVAAVIIAGTVVLVAVFVIIYLTIFDKSNGLRPQIFPGADGKSVTVNLPFPEAAPGSAIQAMGQTVPVQQGQARITIAMDQIKLGTNEIPLLFTEPGKSPEQMTFPIVLRHSIQDDFGGLVTESPFITVAFQIAPGVRLTVDGKPVQAVGNTYYHKINLTDVQGGGATDGDFTVVKLPFQLIDETGAVEQGEHVVAVPLTGLQIDRPAPAAVVISDSITCSGVTDEGAQITVNGIPAAVTVKSFSAVVPVAAVGEHKIVVVARSPGKAPRRAELTVSRVDSLEPAVAEWSKDLDASLDYPTIGRDPNATVGKKIKLNGRVVNISTEKGVTAFILYVGDGCPARSKCAVYVVFRGETDAGLQSWVDVFGTVRGTRAVEMQNGVKIEVPAVDASFVLQTENRTKTPDPKKS